MLQEEKAALFLHLDVLLNLTIEPLLRIDDAKVVVKRRWTSELQVVGRCRLLRVDIQIHSTLLVVLLRVLLGLKQLVHLLSERHRLVSLLGGDWSGCWVWLIVRWKLRNGLALLSVSRRVDRRLHDVLRPASDWRRGEQSRNPSIQVTLVVVVALLRTVRVLVKVI